MVIRHGARGGGLWSPRRRLWSRTCDAPVLEPVTVLGMRVADCGDWSATSLTSSRANVTRDPVGPEEIRLHWGASPISTAQRDMGDMPEQIVRSPIEAVIDDRTNCLEGALLRVASVQASPSTWLVIASMLAAPPSMTLRPVVNRAGRCQAVS